MATSSLPNASPGKTSVRSGSGVTRQKLPFGHLTIRGESGDIRRVSAVDYTNSSGESTILIQASAGSVKVSGTLADPDLALSPDQDDGDHWIDVGTAAPGSVLVPENFFVALKLEFLADAVVYVVNV